MIAILTLLVIVTVSLLVNRIATVALTFTGLSRDTARFQSRVAFTGAGFTTSESEVITTHPVRRRIIMTLMFLGNAGLVTVIATLMTGFVNIEEKRQLDLSQYTITATDDAGEVIPDLHLAFEKIEDTDPGHLSWSDVILGVTPQQQMVSRMLVLCLGLSGLWFFASSKWVDDQLFKIITRMLRRFTRLEAHDFSSVLHISEGYTVSEIEVGPDHWMAGRTLMELRLPDEGLQVLGVMRADKTYVGAATGGTYVRSGDTVIVYGKVEAIDDLVHRRKDARGDAAHGRRTAEHLAERGETEHEERAEPREAEAFD